VSDWDIQITKYLHLEYFAAIFLQYNIQTENPVLKSNIHDRVNYRWIWRSDFV